MDYEVIQKLAGIEMFQSVMTNLSSADNLKITRRKTEMMNEVIEKAGMSEYKIKKGIADDVIEGGLEVWDMPIGGGIINGREYSQHALERMAPNTPSVVEDAISNTIAVTGHTIDTFVHETDDIRVIVNRTGKVITVIPK